MRAATCLYDNKKVVMMRWEDDQPMCLCAVCNRIHERTIAIGLSLGGLCMCGAVYFVFRGGIGVTPSEHL